MSKTTPKPPQEDPIQDAADKPKPKDSVLRGLDAISVVMGGPLTVHFNIKERPCELLARYLNAEESELLKLQLDEIMPPLIRGKNEADDRFDYTNKEYLQRKTITESSVRAQAIFWTCMDVQNKANGEVKKDEMYKPSQTAAIKTFVQKLLPEDVLETIYRQVTRTPISIPKHVNLS